MKHTEDWRDLVRRPGGYSVSSLGKVRRNPHVDTRGWLRTEAELTPFYRRSAKSPHKRKVGFVRLISGDSTSIVPIPELVAEAYLPFEKTLHEIQFRDGNHANWALSNLFLKSRITAKLEKKVARFVQQSMLTDVHGSAGHE